jgi:hypothetical protein
MSPGSGGFYSLTVSGDELVSGTGITTDAQGSYQFVITSRSGDNFNSLVYTDLYLYPCDFSSEPPTEPPVTEPPIVTDSPFVVE